jgi:DnaJ-class molecular chaperone
MIAVTNEIIREGDESMTCLECHGTGIVCHWSEFAFFDDRRYCPLCDAGRRVESIVTDIVKRAESDDYPDYNGRALG